MKHALTIAACLLCVSLNTAHGQETGIYTTYIGGKAAVLDQWTATTDKDGTLKTVAALGAPGAVASQRAVTVAVNHRPMSFILHAGEDELIAADFNGATVKLRVHGQPERELPTKATMVVENLLWHQLVFLLDQYDETKGATQSFVALLPSQALDFPITKCLQRFFPKRTLTALSVDALAADCIVRTKRRVGTVTRGPLSQQANSLLRFKPAACSGLSLFLVD